MKKRLNLLLVIAFLFTNFSVLIAQIEIDDENEDCNPYSGFNFEAYISSANQVANVAFRAGCFYEDRFPNIGEENAGGVDRAFVEAVTYNLLINEMEEETESSLMHPTKLNYHVEDPVNEQTSNVVFEMVGNVTNCTDFEAVYLDYESVYRNSEGSSSAEFTVEVEGGYTKKLFVVKALCGEYTTGRFIIIIDKDAHLQSIFSIPADVGDPESTIELRLGEQAEDTDLKVFPNPINKGEVNVEFNLRNDQSVSISIIEGSTGKTIQSTQQYKEKGSHKQELNMVGLPVGIYYVVLQTEEGRMVERILKM